jgi:hypothetical protein
LSTRGADFSGELAGQEFELDLSESTPEHSERLAGSDVSLVVNLPDGTWVCDDDAAGNLNPGLTFSSPQSGVYDIWIGDLSGDGPGATLYVSELGYQSDGADSGSSGSGVDVSGTPYYGEATLASGFSGDPYSVGLSAGGTNAASSVANGCTGMIGGAPDFNLQYTPGSLPLYISASADEDVTLIVNAPDGRWYCDDDSGSGPLDPGLSWSKPAGGLYNIWVGHFSDGSLVNATLHISELGFQSSRVASDSATGIDYSAAAYYGDVSLTAGFSPDPHVIRVTPGGSNDARSVSDRCAGQIGSAPDVNLEYTSGSLPLYIYAQSGDDTTLVVNTPGGDWICDDDSGVGLNPGIVFKAPASGTYDIWVGRFGDADGQATLNISEIAFPMD